MSSTEIYVNLQVHVRMWECLVYFCSSYSQYKVELYPEISLQLCMYPHCPWLIIPYSKALNFSWFSQIRFQPRKALQNFYIMLESSLMLRSAIFISAKICKWPIRENFVPRKFSAVRYLSTCISVTSSLSNKQNASSSAIIFCLIFLKVIKSVTRWYVQGRSLNIQNEEASGCMCEAHSGILAIVLCILTQASTPLCRE